MAANTKPGVVSALRKQDSVDHPSHYNQGGVETIDYLESTLTDSELVGFMKGNVIKYVSRERYKNGVEDLKKAKWYLDRLIEYIEKNG
jgi:hypothetical protein